jgi:probable F420-dependent oxidoreductase
MHIGLMTTAWEQVDDCVRLGQLAETAGIESVWFGEHSHLPVAEGHAFVKEMPEFYRRIPDPYVVLSAIAASTRSIRLGTGIALPAQGDALHLAKAVATLDQLSHGRFEWGVGYGWNETEMRDHGLDPKHRMDTFGEVVAAVRELWTKEVASFDGVHVRFEECWSYPKPAQSPHPPILLGARAGPRAFSQLVEHCDGWLPSLDLGFESAEASLAELRRRFDDAGRDPASLMVTFLDSRGFWLDVDVETYRAKRRVSFDVVKKVRDLGADRLVVGMPLFRTSDIEPMLDAVAELIPAAS